MEQRSKKRLSMNSQQELLDAINTISQSKDRSCDTPATVLRVEGDTVWVHIDGGADETPVQKTINCEQGETVQVRISNGSAFLVGNASAPPTDDKTANVAHFVAEQADEKATEAIETANAIVHTVREKVDIGDSNIQDLSSTMYQNAYGVNIYNDTLAVGDSYAHIDGNSFDIKQATTAGTIDDANDTVIASFGQEVTVGVRAAGTVGDYSQVFGIDCVASGDYSHAEGIITEANGNYSHAEGNQTYADGYASHAEGATTHAIGPYSHAEGSRTRAQAVESHAEGSQAYATGVTSHAEGTLTIAEGNSSHAEGARSTASGEFSHAQNMWTIAASQAQTAIGKYNIEDDNNIYALIIGNGTYNSVRSDALRADWSGNVQIDGTLQDLSGVSLLDEWTNTATVSSGSITFSNLDDSLDYSRPYFENGLYNVTAMTKSGSGTSTSLTFTTDAPDNTVGKLRIIR